MLACYDLVADGDGGQGLALSPLQYLYFAVSDLEAMLARVEAAGGTIEEGIATMPWGERMFTRAARSAAHQLRG
jgi:predicted enzyme related to lactoylglutathione lyase